MKYSGIGGQAVLEGIMMMNGSDYAVAIRKPDGDIEVSREHYESITKKAKVLRLPFIRGVFRFADSMIVGLRTLSYSAEFLEDDEGGDSEEGPLERFLVKVFGEKAEKVVMGAVMAFSFVIAIAVFMVLPLLLAGLFRKLTPNENLIAVLEGILRIVIFIGYIVMVSRMEDIHRTFMYHGSEHKCINCIEHGLPLTVENVRKSSRFHKRCGTSFLIIVMLISVLLFMVVRTDSVGMRILSRILLVPVIAGISYEVLQLAGRTESKLIDLVSFPGICMQKLTTAEPDDSMIEVAIRAVEEVYDWKAFLRNNFPGALPSGEEET